MAKLDRGDVTLNYEVEGTGPTLLLSNGFSGTTKTFAGQAEALAKSYQVVRWDMRGHGQSDAPDDLSIYSRDGTIDDMVALLSAVGAKSAHIGGHSLGGYLSIELYRRRPDLFLSLLLFNTGPGFKKVEAREGWNAQCLKDALKFEKRHAEQLALPETERKIGSHQSLLGVARAARGILPQHDDLVIKSLPDIDVPTLIVVGDKDHAFKNAAEYMDIKIPNSDLVIIEDAGHNASLDQPEAVTQAISGFLSKL